LEILTDYIGDFHDIRNDLREYFNWNKQNKGEAGHSFFVPIIEDEVVRVSGKSQPSSVVPFVSPVFSVHERFITFSDVSGDRFTAS
jgi:hypothetical protein